MYICEIDDKGLGYFKDPCCRPKIRQVPETSPRAQKMCSRGAAPSGPTWHGYHDGGGVCVHHLESKSRLILPSQGASIKGTQSDQPKTDKIDHMAISST